MAQAERDVSGEKQGLAGAGAAVNARLVQLFRAAITGYRRFVSPLLGSHCRFHPTCSRYALDAIRLHGCWRGGLLALRRLLRCHPLHPGGLDPVPAAQPETTESKAHALH